jgi:hypothetical protein
MAVVISRTEALSLGNVLGTILAAVVDAQAQSARATVEFLNDVGFLPPAEGQPERLRTVSFTYSKLDENQQRAEFTVEVPLLSLVEIPLVSVKKATISFAYEITQATPAPAAPPPPGSRAALFARVAVPAVLKGRITDQTAGARERANLQVQIDLEKSPPPAGLDRIFDILQVAMAEQKRGGGT